VVCGCCARRSGVIGAKPSASAEEGYLSGGVVCLSRQAVIAMKQVTFRIVSRLQALPERR
jgi:hypothetical protein